MSESSILLTDVGAGMAEQKEPKEPPNITNCFCTSNRPAFTFPCAHEATVLKSYRKMAMDFMERNASTLTLSRNVSPLADK